MRLIGHLKSEASARTFAGYLSAVDIRNQIEPDTEGWAVWVYSEDQIDAGHQAFAAFLQNPSDAKFQRAAERVAEIEERARRDAKAYARRIRTSDQIWNRSGRAPLTIGLIVACVAVYVLLRVDPTDRIGGALVLYWRDVLGGQVWRLLTPLFLHFGLMHILFNMLVLYDLGMIIELRQGWKRLALLVVGIGIGSNLAQCFLGGAVFGGMSGVLYGLLGYIWLRGHFDPGSGLFISPMTLAVMLVWFFLCLFHVIPNVANWAHGAGLLLGMAWGAAPPLVRKLL